MFNSTEMIYLFANKTKTALSVYTEHPMVKDSLKTYYDTLKK